MSSREDRWPCFWCPHFSYRMFYRSSREDGWPCFFVSPFCYRMYHILVQENRLLYCLSLHQGHMYFNWGKGIWGCSVILYLLFIMFQGNILLCASQGHRQVWWCFGETSACPSWRRCDICASPQETDAHGWLPRLLHCLPWKDCHLGQLW